MLEVHTTGSNQIWIDKFPLLIFEINTQIWLLKISNDVLDRYKSSPILNSTLESMPVESDDFMSSNKSSKTILYTMKLEKITSRLNLRMKLKICLSK